MPYKNVRFVKLQLEILDDYRFIKLLNDRQKCLYLLLLTLAGRMDNEIPNDLEFIMERVGLKEVTDDDLKKLQEVFPKLLVENDIISFGNYEEIHNYIPGKSKGNPKEIQRTSQIRLDKIRTEDKDMLTSFASFYSKYPRKVGKEKAFKAFLKISPNDALLATILRAVEIQSQSPAWKKNDGEFIPYPATWLNGKRWEDEVGTVNRPRKQVL